MIHSWVEQGLVFRSGANRLVGVAALPEGAGAETGVIILVGGPQYRVGSHRQFALLARDLAAAGIPSLRFDYAGMGDSEGELQSFNAVQGDIGAAIEALRDACPTVRKIALWGLCDAASSAMMFAHQFAEVEGLVLLNPWVHGAEYSPQVKLSHYYRPLLTGPENWGRLFSGKIELMPALRELMVSSFGTLTNLLGMRSDESARHSFVDEMLQGMRSFSHCSLVILSEDDLTAREFASLTGRDKHWKAVMAGERVSSHTVEGADHTFSSRAWKEEVAQLTIGWVKKL